jgi:uncharacterized RDD family membrane protein YckC
MEQQPPPLPEIAIVEGAGFGIRFLARLIDLIFGYMLGILFGIIAGLVLAMLQAAGKIDPGWQHRVRGLSAMGFGLSLLGVILYHTVTEGIYGASLGKLMCRLHVLTADGRPCDMARAFRRSLAYLWDSLFFGLVGYQSMQKSRLNQRYGDVWAKTVVVRTASVPAGAKRPLGWFFLGLFLGALCWGAMLVLALILKAK